MEKMTELKLVGKPDFLGYGQYIKKGECIKVSKLLAEKIMKEHRFRGMFERVSKAMSTEDSAFVIKDNKVNDAVVLDQNVNAVLNISEGKCKCGCGGDTKKKSDGTHRDYVHGHYMRAKKINKNKSGEQTNG